MSKCVQNSSYDSGSGGGTSTGEAWAMDIPILGILFGCDDVVAQPVFLVQNNKEVISGDCRQVKLAYTLRLSPYSKEQRG